MSKKIVVENCYQWIKRNTCNTHTSCPFHDLSDIILSTIPRDHIHPECPLPDLLDVGKIVKDEAVGFADWKDGLTPAQKVSVWSKNGEHRSGLYNMDNEQLYEKFQQSKHKP